MRTAPRTAPQVVGRIKRILVGTAASPEELRTLAQEYLELCLTAQRRLEECGNLLQRGMRSEAIYAAEATPPLLDLMGILEFPDAPEWCEFARRKSLPAPPPFDSNLQNLLEEEWEQQNNVEPLINEYRKLSVGRAPALQRIALLRRLRAADAGNPNWPRDLELLEANRFKQIRMVMRGPSPPNEDDAAAYLEELTAPELVRPAPQDLVELAKSVHARAVARRFETAIRRMAAEVHDAHAAMDLDAVESGLARIAAQSRQDRLPVPSSMAESLEAARSWAAGRRQEVERQQHFEQACADLNAMLASAAGTPAARAGSAIQVLNQSVARLRASGFDMPPDLSARAVSTLASLARRKRMRRLRAVLAVSAVVALCAAGAALGTRYVMISRDRAAIAGRIDEFAARVDDYTSKYEFAAARDYLARIRADHLSLYDAVPIQEAVARLDEREAAENKRVADLDGVLRQARGLSVDDAAFEPLTERAVPLLRTEADHKAIAAARDAATLVQAQRKKATDDQMGALLVRARAACDNAQQANDPALIRHRVAVLAALLNQAEAVKGATAARREEVRAVRAQYADQLSRAEQIEDRARLARTAHQDMLRQIEAARAKLPDVQAYASACEKLHDDYPSAPEVLPVEPWKALVPYYTAVLQASAVAVEAQRRDVPVPTGYPPGSAVAGFRQALAANAFAGESPYQPAVRVMAHRSAFLADFDEATAALRKLLDHPLISAVNRFTVRKDNEAPIRYYAPVHDVVTQDGTFLKFRNYDDQHQINDVAEGHAVKLVDAPYLAPHCALALELSKRLRQEQQTGDWASEIPSMMDYALTFPDANPRARAMILAGLAKVNDEAGNPAELTPALAKAIGDLSPDYVNFLTPSDDPKVAATLSDIDGRTKDLAARLSPLLKAAAASQLLDRADVAPLYRPLVVSAIVARGADGTLAVEPLAPGPGGKPRREFWVVTTHNGQPVFAIAALRRDGAAGAAPTIAWVTGITPPPPGQPLLSPDDDADTAKFAAKYGLTPAAAAARPGWPVNLAGIQPSKK